MLNSKRDAADKRPPFDDAVLTYIKFIEAEGKSPDLLWASKDRLCLLFQTVWVFRPSELASDEYARRYYEEQLKTDHSIGFRGICSVDGRYLVAMEVLREEGRLPDRFYMSVLTAPKPKVRVIKSRILWRLLNKFPKLTLFDKNWRGLHLDSGITRS